MLRFIVITNNQISIQYCLEVDFESFLEKNVGINFGCRQLTEGIVIEDNILEELNPIATQLFNKNFYGTIVYINKIDDKYFSLTDSQLEILYENY